MIHAYMIVDFDNPISVQYMNRSIKSFAPVKDILTIEPVQCTKPETLPIRYKKNQEPIPFYVLSGGDHVRARFFGGTFDDHPIYQSIMHSHYMLIKRMALGEDIVIMEHDAALVNEESFRAMYNDCWGKVEGFFPGVCMEFYNFSQEFATWFIQLMDDYPYFPKRMSGPMGVITCSGMLGWDDYDTNWLLPAKQYYQSLFSTCGSGIDNSFNANGKSFSTAVKQFYCVSAMNTNVFSCDTIVDDRNENARSINGQSRRELVIFDEF